MLTKDFLWKGLYFNIYSVSEIFGILTRDLFDDDDNDDDNDESHNKKEPHQPQPQQIQPWKRNQFFGGSRVMVDFYL